MTGAIENLAAGAVIVGLGIGASVGTQAGQNTVSQNQNYSLSDVYRLFQDSKTDMIHLAGTDYVILAEYVRTGKNRDINVLFVPGVKYRGNEQLRLLAPDDPKLISHLERQVDDDVLIRVKGDDFGDDDSDYMNIPGFPTFVGSEFTAQHKKVYAEVINDIARALVARQRSR